MAKRRASKPKAPKPPQEWRRLPEIDPLVQELIGRHHKHLERAKITVLGKPKAGKRHGKEVVATVRRPTSAMKALLADEVGEIHYLIEIGLDRWGASDQKAKRRILDKALCHFTGLDEKDRWAIIGPDVQEFTAILKRHGAYDADLELFCQAARQLVFPEMETSPAST